MNTYLVQLTFEAPYPKIIDYTIKAGTFGLAAKRAFDQFKHDKLTTKRQNKLSFTVIKLSIPKGDDTNGSE